MVGMMLPGPIEVQLVVRQVITGVEETPGRLVVVTTHSCVPVLTSPICARKLIVSVPLPGIVPLHVTLVDVGVQVPKFDVQPSTKLSPVCPGGCVAVIEPVSGVVPGLVSLIVPDTTLPAPMQAA